MNILPEAMPGLRALLLAPDDLCAALDQQDALIAPAQIAVDRLRSQIADLDGEATELANQHLPADEDRIARLIAGEDVEQLDRKTMEARAIKEGVLAAKRRQLSQDAAALEQHLDGLRTKASGLQTALADAEGAFLRALADAVLETYKRNAVEFIRANMPALHSVAARLRARTGEPARWAKRVFPGPLIQWWEDEMVPDPERPGTEARVHLHTTVWPRRDECLLSGESVYSDSIFDALVGEIRGRDAA